MKVLNNYTFVKNAWSYIREKKILKSHKKVSAFWLPIIASYSQNKLPLYQIKGKKDVQIDKIIWQYWGQGVEGDLPEVVKRCFMSVDRHKGDWTVIRLDDASVSEYLDIPDFVNQKMMNGIFNKTFYSDLLRLALLKEYGGVWLDATIFMTGSIPEKFSNMDYFVFQRDIHEEHKRFWKSSYAYYWNWDRRFEVNMLTSIFFSKKGSEMVTKLLDLMLYYWGTQGEVKNYFFFQILYNNLVKGEFEELRCEIVSDVLPHVLQTKFNGQYPYVTLQQATLNSNLHKMSYFEGEALEKFKSFSEDQEINKLT